VHGERLAARGGADPLARGLVDPRMFVETSSYGRRAVDSILRVLGVDMLVFGSDRPYAQPNLDPALGEAAFHFPTHKLPQKTPCHPGAQKHTLPTDAAPRSPPQSPALALVETLSSVEALPRLQLLRLPLAAALAQRLAPLSQENSE
jgi:hypothetical protein